MAAEIGNAQRVVAGSGVNERPPTPYEALMTVAPASGEAGGPLAWTAMTVAGLCRLALACAGWLPGELGRTRTRAGVTAGLFLLAMLLAWLAGYQPPAT